MAVAERFVDALLRNIVFLICILPLVGAVLTILSSRLGAAHSRSTALTNASLTLLLSLLMVANYDPTTQDDGGRFRDIQMTSGFRWIGPFDSATPESGGTNQDNADSARGAGRLSRVDIRFAVGVDGISLWPIILASLLTVVAIVAGGNVDQKHPASLYALLLIQQSVVVCLFASLDVVLFCVCLQLSLLPMYFLIGAWGGGMVGRGYERRPLARRFLLFNLGGGLVVIIGLMSVALIHADLVPPFTFTIPRLMQEFPIIVGSVGARDWSSVGPWILCALLAGFATRLPALPCHIWFVPSNCQTALPTRLLLAGLFPLIGLYGLTRFVVPLLQASDGQFASAMQAAAIGGTVYFGLLAYAQQNLDRLAGFACLSATHLGAAGVLSLTQVGTTGGLLYALGMALSVCAFVLAVNRERSDEHRSTSSVYRVLCALALMGVPGFAGFAGALLTLMGLFAVNIPAAIGGMLGWLLVACAVIRSIGNRLQWIAPGDHRKERKPATSRRNTLALLVVLIAIIVWIGLYPEFITSRMSQSVARVLNVIGNG
jgi:NADH-quinone oxidoreductase subunit M